MSKTELQADWVDEREGATVERCIGMSVDGAHGCFAAMCKAAMCKAPITDKTAVWLMPEGIVDI
jgi:hypothetical protein